jgi:hypothetical protein
MGPLRCTDLTTTRQPCPPRSDGMERPTFAEHDPFALSQRHEAYRTLLAAPETIDNAPLFGQALTKFGAGIEFSHPPNTTVDVAGFLRPGLLRCITVPATRVFGYGHSGNVVSLLSTGLRGEIALADLTVILPGGDRVPLAALPADQLPKYLHVLKISAMMVARSGYGSRFPPLMPDSRGKKSAAMPQPYRPSRSKQARTASGS